MFKFFRKTIAPKPNYNSEYARLVARQTEAGIYNMLDSARNGLFEHEVMARRRKYSKFVELKIYRFLDTKTLQRRQKILHPQ